MVQLWPGLPRVYRRVSGIPLFPWGTSVSVPALWLLALTYCSAKAYQTFSVSNGKRLFLMKGTTLSTNLKGLIPKWFSFGDPLSSLASPESIYWGNLTSKFKDWGPFECHILCLTAGLCIHEYISFPWPSPISELTPYFNGVASILFPQAFM